MYERTANLLQQKFKSYLLPTIMMTMALSLGSVVDSLIVANFLDTTAFSCVGLCQPIILCFNTVFNFFGVGGATLAAIAKGKKDDERANKIFSSAFFILLIFSILFMVIGTVFIDNLADLLSKGQPLLKDNIKQYAIGLILGCPFIILVSGMVFFVRTDGFPKLASNIIIVSNVINLIFDFVLVAIIKIGILGAAVSTVLGYFCGIIFIIKYFRSKERTFKLVKPPGNIFGMGKELFTSGISSGMNTGLMFIKNLTVNMVVMSVAVLGSNGVAAFNVCNQTLTLAALFVGGTIQSILPIIGVLYGEEDKVGIKMTMKTAFKFAFTSAVILFAVLEICAGIVANIFNLSGEAYDIAVNAIRCYSLMLPFYSFNFIMINFYQTTQKKLLSAIFAAFQGFVYVVPAVMIVSRIGDGTRLWLGFPIGEVLTFVSIWIISYIYGKKHNLNGILLERKCECGSALEITIKNNISEAVDISYKVMDFCKQNGIDATKAQCAAFAVEEMASNTIKYGYNKNKLNYIDINIKIIDEMVNIAIRDDGVFFNPTVFKTEDMEFSGIENVKKIASEVKYSRVLGFNTTIIKL